MKERSIFEMYKWGHGLDPNIPNREPEKVAENATNNEKEKEILLSPDPESPKLHAISTENATNETVAEYEEKRLAPDNNVNMEVEAAGHAAQRIEKLFQEALKDIKIQVQAPEGYALFPEPTEETNYTLEETQDE